MVISGYRKSCQGCIEEYADSALCEDRRSAEGFAAACPAAASREYRAAAQRRGAGDVGNDAGDTRLHLRGQVAAARPHPPAAPVPLRPARKGEAERAGSQLFKPLRQVIESINETFKGQLDLERHRSRTPGGVTVRVLQRIHALTTPSGTTTTPASQPCAR